MDYYEKLLNSCKKLGETEIIGSTVGGYGIPLVRTGKDAKTLIVASVHAREHLTTDFVFELLKGEKYPFDAVPCLNIDGVILAKYGASFFSKERREFVERINGKADFSLWKANLNAVDLNVNFDARWGTGRQNVTLPSPANYIGSSPESEPETKAIAALFKRKKYAQVVCYHTKGEVVYWGFENNRYHYKEAKKYAESVGYTLMTAEGSAGGLKDKFDLVCDGLGLTVELGEDRFRHPYPQSELPKLIEKHKRSIKILYDNGEEVARKIYGGGDSRSQEGLR